MTNTQLIADTAMLMAAMRESTASGDMPYLGCEAILRQVNRAGMEYLFKGAA